MVLYAPKVNVMQTLVRDNLGYIDLDEMGCEYQSGTFFIEGEKYYYKDSAAGAFKELIIDELAKDAGIVCAFYDLASLFISLFKFYSILSLFVSKEIDLVVFMFKLLEEELNSISFS